MAQAVSTAQSGNTWIDGLEGATRWDDGGAAGTRLRVYVAGLSGEEAIPFKDESGTYSLIARPMAGEELAALQSAFANAAAVANLQVELVGSRAQADVVASSVDNLDGLEALGWAYLPGESTDPATGRTMSVLALNRENYDYFAPGSGAGVLLPGSYAYVTFIHEFGHILGLEHPHDPTGDAPNFPGVTQEFDDFGAFAMNQGVFTTMSYNSGWSTGPLGALPPEAWGFEKGYMALDIAALQHMYGANMTTRTGNDLYALPGANGPGTGWSCLWDAGGIDTVQGDGRLANVIDLRAATLRDEVGGGGRVSSAMGVWGGLTIAHGVVIENARGGASSDWMTGNAADNLLKGLAGADSLTGLDGRDALMGGAGDDRLAGGWGADRLWGGEGSDVLLGGAGNDSLTGGRGMDDLGGGAGDDVFRFTGPRDAEEGPDRIRDFARGDDRIDLSAIDARPGLPGDQAFVLDRGGAFAVGEIRQEVLGSRLLLEVNLDPDADPELRIEVLGLRAPLAAADFLL